MENIEQQNTETIAIIGIACRFPGAKNYNQFWVNLETGVNSISEIPPQRWEVEKHYSAEPKAPNKTISKWAGLIEGIDQFDAQFFGISPREAKRIDPQQRIMLELSWSCIEDAGYSPSKLSGSQIGVFMGVCNYDYDQLQHKYEKNVNGHSGTGTWNCMLPNRISSYFNFHGPSIPIDTACSSSLVAVHYAINAINESECEMALVAGVSVCCTPTRYIQMSQLGMLSPTGQCKTFDSEANGYVRGEGAGVILLKPLAKAMADGDRIYGVIKGSAINHGGKAKTLTSPNIYAQSQVLRAAYTRANVAPNTVSYIEAHGTGTPLGDPMEINALKRGFRQLYKQYELKLSKKPYCGLGAVKTNIGHLEGAAGIAGVIKVLLAMKHKRLPKIVNFQELNPRIEFKDSPFYIVTETEEWQQLQTETGEMLPRRAGVSSFGIGGVNAHVVLEETPIQVKSEDFLERPLHLLTLSAKTEKALQELASNYENYLTTHPELELADICHTANIGRNHFNHRLAIIASNQQELVEKLQQHKQEKEVPGIFSGKLAHGITTPKIAFCFTGEGFQYVNMGQQLYETQPTFRQALDKCDNLLRPYLEKPLLEILYPQQPQKSSPCLLDQSAYSQPALFSIEYALAQLWQSWGIKPDVLLGQNVGEYVAACLAGVFTLEDGLKLIATRGKLIQQSPNSDEIIDTNFAIVAQEISYSQPQIPLISNVTGKELGNEITSAEYWVNHLWESLPLTQSIETLNQEGYEIFLEIGMCRGWETKTLQKSQLALSLQTEWEQILETVAKLYIKGVNADWSGLDKDYIREKVALPIYPFQRQSYWIETSEKEEQKNIPENDSSLIFQLISQGDIEGLTQELNQAQKLTLDEKKLLPKLLETLINKHKNNLQYSEKSSGILQKLGKTQNKDRQQLMLKYLQGVVGKLLGLDESVNLDLELGFVNLGLNYSMMVELGEILQKTFGCSVSVSTLLDYFDIQKLSKYLLVQIYGGELEKKNETSDLTNEIQEIRVEGEIEPLYEEAIATAIQETEVATVIQEELKEITLLLNNEGN